MQTALNVVSGAGAAAAFPIMLMSNPAIII
jgi:hypothetical protein